MSEKVKRMAGKTIPLVVILGLMILVSGIVLNGGVSQESQKVQADNATTSVTVGNSPPTWDTDAEESAESSATNPTDVGSVVGWVGTASDSNGDDYYLLICSTSSAPTGNSSAPPTCAGGGGNQWAVSSNTTSTEASSASYTAQSGDPESNIWYAFICDGNSGGGLCNATYKQGTGSTISPFAVNHYPVFNIVSNDGPQDPGDNITWSTDGSTTDPDSVGGQDTVVLTICKTAGWSTSTDQCSGEFWCSSTAVTSNPTCSYTIPTPTQDKTYGAFAYLVDVHGLEASGGYQATSTDYDVSNVAPTIQAASISLLDTDGTGNLTLLPGYAETETPGFMVTGTISDNNSCQADGGGSEIATSSSVIYVYRSGVAGSCSSTVDSDPNNCYAEVGTLEIGACGGTGDSDVAATWTFSLWFLADPTSGADATDSPWFAENWLASAKPVDDDNASSTTQGSTGNELDTFLAYDLLTTAIPYGTVSPGFVSNEATTTLKATGNVGLDENLSGVDMQRQGGGDDIAIGQQHYSTSTGFAWADGATTTVGAVELELDCSKSTSTSSPATKDTYWLIKIPGAKSTGTYNGTNTIAILTSEAQGW